MFCSQCATEVPEHGKYCPNCAAPQLSDAETIEPKASSSIGKKIFISILLVILCFLGFVFYSQNCASSRKDPNEGLLKEMATRPILPAVIVPLLDNEKSLVIEPGHYHFVKFTVIQHSKNVRIDGRFQASGGSGNDIEVFIVDEDGFLNFQNDHTPATFYNSGNVTADTLNVQLPSTEGATAPVTYYLILSNKFSVQNKVVDGNITLHYDML